MERGYLRDRGRDPGEGRRDPEVIGVERRADGEDVEKWSQELLGINGL